MSTQEIKNLLINIEKLYFLTTDEVSNQEFIDLILEIQNLYQDQEIFNFLEEIINKKTKILQKIRKLKIEVEKDIEDSIQKLSTKKTNNKELIKTLIKKIPMSLKISRKFLYYHTLDDFSINNFSIKEVNS